MEIIKVKVCSKCGARDYFTKIQGRVVDENKVEDIIECKSCGHQKVLGTKYWEAKPERYKYEDELF